MNIEKLQHYQSTSLTNCYEGRCQQSLLVEKQNKKKQKDIKKFDFDGIISKGLFSIIE